MAGNTNNQRGFTYFGALFLIALIGLALSGAALVWQTVQQREKERELLFIGQQYIDAIASYYHAAPGGNKKYPRSIADLLRDPRYPYIKRHLRKPWRDPTTFSKEWGLVYTKQGGIAGIYSLGKGTPLKQGGFGILDTLLAGKASYQDWKFIYIAATDEKLGKSIPDVEETDIDSRQSLDENQDNENNLGNDEEEETGEELLSPEFRKEQAASAIH